MKELWFDAGGIRLAGHLARPAGAGQPRPGVVLCHGFPQVAGGAAYVGRTFPSLAQRIADSLGWVVLSFSFRGCGASEGDFSLAGWLEDVGAATSELRRQERVVGTWLAGFGTGGAIAVCAASQDDEVLGVVTMAAPADFDDWANHPRRLREFSREVGAIRSSGFPVRFEAWAAELRSTRAVTCAETLAPRPLMVVHGSDDVNVPVLDARILADAHGEAELRIVSGASHDLHLDPRPSPCWWAGSIASGAATSPPRPGVWPRATCRRRPTSCPLACHSRAVLSQARDAAAREARLTQRGPHRGPRAGSSSGNGPGGVRLGEPLGAAWRASTP